VILFEVLMLQMKSCYIELLYVKYCIAAKVSGQEKDQAKQIFTSSAASGILTNDLVKILQDEKVSGDAEIILDAVESCMSCINNHFSLQFFLV